MNCNPGGGNLVQTIRRSYSLSDLSEPDVHRTQDEIDEVVNKRPQQRMLRPRMQTPVGRSASGSRHSTGMYFTDVDVNPKGAVDFNYSIRSSEDISSGYSSAEPISIGLSRTSSMTNASKARIKSKKSDDDVLLFHVLNSEEGDDPLNRDGVRIRNIPWYFVQNQNEDSLIHEALLKNYHQKSIAEQYERRSSQSLNIFSSSVSDLESRMIENDSEDMEDEEFLDTFSNEKEIQNLQHITPILGNEKTEALNIQKHLNNEFVRSETKSFDDDDNENKSEEFLDTTSTTSGIDILENLDSAISSQSEEYNQKDIEDRQTNLNQQENIKIRPNELKLALEEIKENFRLNINSPKQEIILKDDAEQNIVKARHNKGKAPAPPPYDKPIETISATSSSSSVRSSFPVNENNSLRKGNLFKNIKSNLFRTAENKNYQLTADQRKYSSSSVHRETEI